MALDHGARPGMVDVARVAGVSHQTVSRVLNNHPNVRPSTRAKVEQAIAELGYRRNSAARALVTQRSATIGVVTPGSGHYGPAQTQAAVEQSARAAGYFVTVATAAHPTAEGITAIFERFLDQSVEGAVVIAPTQEIATAARQAAAHVPVVMVSASPSEQGADAVGVDQAAGARMVARHLLDLGHRDVVHLAGPQDWFDARVRAQSWHATLADSGIRARPDIAGDWSAAAGFAAGQELLPNLPTAVFCANDHMALGMLRAFAEAGVAVPQHVSVVGFDDLTGADHFFPPLTTVRQDFTSLGERALQALAAAIKGESAETPPVLPVLIARQSSGSAPALAPAGPTP